MKNISELTTKIDSSRLEIAKSIKDQTEQLKAQNSYLFKPTRKEDSVKIAKIVPGPWIEKKLADLKTGYRSKETEEYALSHIQNLKSQVETDLSILINKQKDIWRSDVERWHKLTMAFSCLVFFLIGSSLGSIIKKGGFGMPVLVSISFFIFYYVLMQLGDKYAKEGLIPVIVGVWMPNLVLMVIGLFLMRKASNDARLFENDTYNTIFSKISAITKKLRKKEISALA
jgi:lipopolysaccharide export system permease protein